MASKRRIRRNACGGKIRHATEVLAKRQIAGLIRNGRTQGGYVVSYKCRWCGGYHVGHDGRRAP